MDVAYGDNMLKPRRLILEVNTASKYACYSTLSETGGEGGHSDYSLRTQEEWLEWIEKFRDEKTGREMREAIEAVKAPFTEPKVWAEFRERYKQTGDPWLPS